MDKVKQVAEFHLEQLRRSSLSNEDKTFQVTSRIPVPLKIRLDLCADFLGVTRNALLIDVLEAALPSVEEALRDSSCTHEEVSSAGAFGPFTYDQAVEAFTAEYHRTGKAPGSLGSINEMLAQANAEFIETGAVSDETTDALRALGVDLAVLKGEAQ